MTRLTTVIHLLTLAGFFLVKQFNQWGEAFSVDSADKLLKPGRSFQSLEKQTRDKFRAVPEKV